MTARNQTGWTRPQISLKLHLDPVFEIQDADYVQKDLMGKGRTVRYVTWLKPHQEASYQVEIRISKRGRYLLEPLYLSSGDFLGMTEISRRMSRVQELVVPPREQGLPALDAAMGGFLGELSVNRFLYQDPILTAGYRPYTSQDPMRSISWKQSARGLGLVSKKYDSTTEPRVVCWSTRMLPRKNRCQRWKDAIPWPGRSAGFWKKRRSSIDWRLILPSMS